ncbi:MAG: group II intron reverse transcriptase/maturase [Opitutaceae bacterium]|nr:group II intron reverse transcriptase/maturase [Opitutaceae bacterium]
MDSVPQSVSRSLLALRQKAAAEPKYRFRSLYRMIDLPMLYECFYELRRAAAPGVDGLDVAEFGERLDERLADLLERLKAQTYRAQLVRRRYIPKPGSAKQRPLGIPVVEDKLVQLAASRILEAIYEADFLDSSMGYRGGRGARAATQRLQHVLFHGRIGWIVEADIEGFFDHLDHDWLIKMLEQRVNDRGFLRLIRKWLKAGILEEDGRVLHPATGTPQGGIVSPILANIYLHYVLDLWTERTVRRGCRGQLGYMRYADDFVCGFEEETEARRYLDELRGRLAKFGLKLAEAKSGIVRFQRNDPDSGAFTFLGFDFYWGNTRRDFRTVKRRTSKKKVRVAFAALSEWLRANRNRRLRWLGEGLCAKFQGHWNYFGVIGNSRSLQIYWRGAKRLVFKWWNRRSQRRSYNWTTFEAMWQTLGLPVPRIVETPYQAQRLLPLPS